MKQVVLVPLVIFILVAVAYAEADQFLVRDGNVAPGSTYMDSDGAEPSDTPEESPWENYVEGAAPPSARFEIPGPWPIKRTSPQLQSLVFGPTFRNQKNRIEVGAGLGYVNSKWRFPFELSIEPTWRRNKSVSSSDRNFARIRTFGLVELWDRSSDWESTAVAAFTFYDVQNRSFNTLELGGSVSEVIGRRLAFSADLKWVGDWPRGAEFNNAAVVSFGASYNLGNGVRVGGFYEPDNNAFNEDDFGGFFAWQFLPFLEFNINAGKHEFILARLMFTYALERS